jgi:tetratricopeptide (TPR) repeat protein
MQRWARGALSGLAVLGLAAGLLAVGAAAGSPPDSAPAPAGSAAPAGDPLARSIADLQADLERVPGNFRSWSELGFLYLRQARTTADPSLYGKAERAFDRALELRPENNDTALTGKAALAAARHDFAQALTLSDQALVMNAFNPTTLAVRIDALTELGRYDQARTTTQELLDLRPGVDAFSRGSYALELRGDVERAGALLRQAAAIAADPADIAFAQYYLGELAWNTGDLQAARASYDDALVADPDYLPALAGRAKVLAAEGDAPAAMELYSTVVDRLPQPEFLVAYGELLEATGRTDEAQEQFAVVRAVQQLFAANGQDVDTELALFEADHGDPAAAVALAEQAYAKRPDSVFTQDAYAWALHAAGRSTQALPIARQAVRLGLQSPALYYRLGAVEAAAGKPAAARISLQKALSLNPQFSPLHAPKAAALLASLQ